MVFFGTILRKNPNYFKAYMVKSSPLLAPSGNTAASAADQWYTENIYKTDAYCSEPFSGIRASIRSAGESVGMFVGVFQTQQDASMPLTDTAIRKLKRERRFFAALRGL